MERLNKPVITDSAADLQAKVETLNGMIQASPLAIVAVDHGGIVQMWNAQAETVFGWTADEAVGTLLPTIPKGKEPEFRSIMESQLQGRENVGVELRRQRKDGSFVDVSFLERSGTHGGWPLVGDATAHAAGVGCASTTKPNSDHTSFPATAADQGLSDRAQVGRRCPFLVVKTFR